MNLKPYRKLIVALLIPIIGLALKAMGIDLEFGEDQASSLMNVIIPVLTAAGVWGISNDS